MYLSCGIVYAKKNVASELCITFDDFAQIDKLVTAQGYSGALNKNKK